MKTSKSLNKQSKKLEDLVGKYGNIKKIPGEEFELLDEYIRCGDRITLKKAIKERNEKERQKKERFKEKVKNNPFGEVEVSVELCILRGRNVAYYRDDNIYYEKIGEIYSMIDQEMDIYPLINKESSFWIFKEKFSNYVSEEKLYKINGKKYLNNFFELMVSYILKIGLKFFTVNIDKYAIYKDDIDSFFIDSEKVLEIYHELEGLKGILTDRDYFKKVFQGYFRKGYIQEYAGYNGEDEKT